MAYAKNQVLSLYRDILRQSYSFGHYNFREYFVRRTRDQFRANITVNDNTAFYNEALKDLQLLKRQATISNMYHFDKLVVEKL